MLKEFERRSTRDKKRLIPYFGVGLLFFKEILKSLTGESKQALKTA
jgi:hypothetical protein